LLIHCDACSTPRPPDAAFCPHCGTADAHEAAALPADCAFCPTTGGDVPKITKNNGPSIAELVAGQPELVDLDDHVVVPEADAEEALEVEPVDDSAPAQAQAQAEPASAIAEAPTDGNLDDGVSPSGAVDEAGAEGSGPAGLSRPAGNASKSDWFDYCVALGFVSVDGIGPDDYTRDRLIEIAESYETGF